MMGGDVTVTSEPGKGSAFTVRLPGGGTHKRGHGTSLHSRPFNFLAAIGPTTDITGL